MKERRKGPDRTTYGIKTLNKKVKKEIRKDTIKTKQINKKYNNK